MMRFDNDYMVKLSKEKKQKVMDMLSKEKLVGKFNFRPDNAYAWIDTHDSLAYMTKKFFDQEQFVVRWTIRKQKQPAQHISVMMTNEYNKVPRNLLVKAMHKFRTVKYKITDMEVIPHTEKTGRAFYLVVVRVYCEDVHKIREMLKLTERADMRPHITLLEKEVV